MVATGPLGPPLSDAERAEADAVRSACLAEALKGDEVYVVHVDGRVGPVYVFGHREDAEAFEAAVWRERSDVGRILDVPVCDHADARRLIEQEEA